MAIDGVSLRPKIRKVPSSSLGMLVPRWDRGISGSFGRTAVSGTHGKDCKPRRADKTFPKKVSVRKERHATGGGPTDATVYSKATCHPSLVITTGVGKKRRKDFS